LRSPTEVIGCQATTAGKQRRIAMRATASPDRFFKIRHNAGSHFGAGIMDPRWNRLRTQYLCKINGFDVEATTRIELVDTVMILSRPAAIAVAKDPCGTELVASPLIVRPGTCMENPALEGLVDSRPSLGSPNWAVVASPDAAVQSARAFAVEWRGTAPSPLIVPDRPESATAGRRLARVRQRGGVWPQTEVAC
jgi:hypothetical protein